MAGILSPIGGAGAQFFNNAGVVLAGGQLFTYAAGSTTPLATYTDSTLAVANGNPVVLDSSGRPTTEIWLQNNTAYKFVLKDANNNTIGTWDNITGINSSNSTVSEWVVNGLAVSYSNATTFTVAGNQTGIFAANRRIQYGLSGGTFYGYVGSSSYDGVSTTTVVIVPDITNLNSTLSYVNQGFLNPTNPSIPQQYLTSLAPINIAQNNSNNVTYSSVNGTGTNYAGAGWGVSANGQTLNFYMTPTQTTSASATAAVLSYAWSSYRPLSVNVGTGVVSLDATGVGTNVGPSATGTTVLPLVGGGYGAIYPSVVTPSAINYAMAYNGTTTVVNAPTTAILAGGTGTVTVNSSSITANKSLQAAAGVNAYGNYSSFGYNSAGAYPSSAQPFAVATNFTNGQAEVDFWNTSYSATTSFNWYQQTGTSAGTLLASLSPTGNLSVTNSINGNNVTGRNKIINGDFRIAQRGLTQALTTAFNYGSVDRWSAVQIGTANGYLSQVVVASPNSWGGCQYAAQLGRNAGSALTGNLAMQTVLETANSIPLQGKTITLSFYAETAANFSASGNLLSVFMASGTGTDQSGASFGGWTGQTTLLAANPAITASPARYSFTATVPSNATQIGLQIGYTPTGTAGADDSFYITGVQLEVGSVATQFEILDYSIEFLQCLRYYQQVPLYNGTNLVGTCPAISGVVVPGTLPVPLRGTGIYAGTFSGVASNLSVSVGSTVGVVTSVTGVQIVNNPSGPSTQSIYNITVHAPGFTAGQACFLYDNSGTTHFFNFSAEL